MSNITILGVSRDILNYFNKNRTSILDLHKDNVILLLIDGLTTSLAKKISKNFQVIRSLNIPSTAPVITSINLLKYPGEHGIYAWYTYSDLFREVIEPLPYFSEEGKINTKYHLLLEEFKTIYQKLNCKSYTFVPNEYVDSNYNRAISKGSERVGYRTLSEIIVKIKEVLKEKERKFIYIYYPKLDTLNHLYGPNSKYALEELRWIKYFLKRLQRITKDMHLIITADHGFVRLNKRKQISIDKIIEYTEFISGEQRNLFIKSKEGFEDKILDFLENQLKKKSVKTTLKILDRKSIKNLLGAYTNKVKHLEGSIFLQIKDNGFIKRYEKAFLGDHGGSSKEEIEIPLIILN